MKTRLRMLVLVLICFSCALTSVSQVVCDKELICVWVYTKYQVRDKVFSNDFSSIKIYGADGEYCSAQVQRLKSGAYKIYRPFNIVTKGEIKPAAQDFVNYIMSKEGQAIITKSGYIGNEKANDYKGFASEGKVVVAGSSSVTPVMEKLKEAYKQVNPKVNVEVQQSDSSTGVKAVLNGLCDIGMASRGLKQSEVDKGARNTVIANDGIAVIVNKDNKINELTKAKVADIFMGKTTEWKEL